MKPPAIMPRRAPGDKAPPRHLHLDGVDLMDDRELDLEAEGITQLPGHVAIIMDGNGRWARKRGRPRLMGHREGAKSVRRAVRTAYRVGVRHLTLFAFSAQNWERPPQEVEGLMVLLLDYIQSERHELLDRGIRFRTMGDLDLLPEKVRREVVDLQEKSKDNEEMDLNIALSYGAREEILHAVRQLSVDVAAGSVQPEDIDGEVFSRYMYAPELPDPDLLIRTSGERRISNFMLWQIAYTELHITDVLWPDFTEEHFLEALRDYNSRERRFGKTGQQLQEKR
jgi:undecaprenyl diphosphate synthase